MNAVLHVMSGRRVSGALILKLTVMLRRVELISTLCAVPSLELDSISMGDLTETLMFAVYRSLHFSNLAITHGGRGVDALAGGVYSSNRVKICGLALILFSDSVIDRDGSKPCLVIRHDGYPMTDVPCPALNPPTPPAPTQACQSTKAIIAQDIYC